MHGRCGMDIVHGANAAPFTPCGPGRPSSELAMPLEVLMRFGRWDEGRALETDIGFRVGYRTGHSQHN